LYGSKKKLSLPNCILNSRQNAKISKNLFYLSLGLGNKCLDILNFALTVIITGKGLIKRTVCQIIVRLTFRNFKEELILSFPRIRKQVPSFLKNFALTVIITGKGLIKQTVSQIIVRLTFRNFKEELILFCLSLGLGNKCLVF
jgi:dipeptide/tripeptide permease